MATYKELLNRTEEAERIAGEASRKAEEATLLAAERVAQAEVEIRYIKDRAEEFIREAKARIISANAQVAEAQALMRDAQAEAQPYGHERDEWWQKVFLVVVGTMSDPMVKTHVKAAHAAGVATAAVQARAELLKSGLNGGGTTTLPKAKKSPSPKETPEVPAANWAIDEIDPA